MSRRKRAAAERRGRLAEWAAAGMLMLKGYRLIAHRARTPYGEVDLAALHRGVLVIVEVKARPKLSLGLEAVGPHQRRRLEQAAVALAARWRLSALPIRFDVVVVRPWAWPDHVHGAWLEGDR
jgi:putative endonuclease